HVEAVLLRGREEAVHVLNGVVFRQALTYERPGHPRFAQYFVLRVGENQCRVTSIDFAVSSPVKDEGSVQRSPCRCASTNHSHLSMPRDTSVNRSAVSRSRRSLAWSMPFRAAEPNAASAKDSASTWLQPSTAFAGYSASDDRCAAVRAVPSATPPS